MRSIQRGIATSIILIIFLILGIAVVSGYFIFSANLQKLKSINSFEDCAKYYPVMESYPQQCNTPDGQHFVQELSGGEQKKLVPSLDPDEIENWELYTNRKKGYSIKYPRNKYVNCKIEGEDDLYLFEGNSQDTCTAGEQPTDFLVTTITEPRKTESSETDCYIIKKEPVTVSGMQGYKYTYKAVSLEGKCNTMENHYRGAFDEIEVSYKGINYQISLFNKTDPEIKYKILSTFKFLE